MVEKIYWGISFIVVIILFGFFLEKFLFDLLCKFAQKTKLELDDILLNILRKRIGKWSILFAVYVFLHYFPISNQIINFIRDCITVLFIMSFTWMVSECATSLITIYAKKTPKIIPSTSIFINLTNSLLFIFAIIFTLQSFGISVAPLITALGVGGLAVALALQDTLSNFFAGLHLLIARPVRPGDYIRLDSGEEGYVMDITWRNTAIEDLMKNMIIVPNSKMTEAKIINYNLPQKHMMIVVPLSVSNESNLDKVEKIAFETAKLIMEKVNEEDCGINPMVRFNSLGENSIGFNVSLCVKQFSSQYFMRHEFIKLLQKKFILENIKLPEPTCIITIKEKSNLYHKDC